MPLKRGTSKETVGANIKTEKKHGKAAEAGRGHRVESGSQVRSEDTQEKREVRRKRSRRATAARAAS